MRKHARLGILVAMLGILALALTSGATSNNPVIEDGSELEVQILALNDFHGNLQPPAGSSGRVGRRMRAGRSTSRRTSRRSRRRTRNSIVVSAGDLIGASPLLSALFHDEPTIEAMNLIGLDLNAVGNHEFDEGTEELLRMQSGGCHPVDGCQDGDDFAGADFEFLAANVVNSSAGKTLFAAVPDREVRRRQGRLHRHDARGHAEHRERRPVSRATTFLDEADTVNALIARAQEQGVEAIVVLLHEGGARRR